MKLHILQIFLLLTICTSLQAQRGRVYIQDGTLVTDQGTLLRGAFNSLDVSDYLPSEEELDEIKKLGLNCVHLYAECSQFQTVGERVELVDSLVNMTERDSLYLVLTIGGCYQSLQYD